MRSTEVLMPSGIVRYGLYRRLMRPYPPSGIAPGSDAPSLLPQYDRVVLPAPSPVTIRDPSITVLPRMSMLPATTTPTIVLGASAGFVNEPISMFTCGATSVAVWSTLLLNMVAPVNSHVLAKWVYAVAYAPIRGPLNVQSLNRRLLPSVKPYELVAVRVVVLAKEPLLMRFAQVMPSSLLVVTATMDVVMLRVPSTYVTPSKTQL